MQAGEPPNARYNDTTWLALHFLPHVAVWRLAWELPSSNLGRNTHNSMEFVITSEVCHPCCVFKLQSEVNSVKNTTINIWLNDGVY